MIALAIHLVKQLVHLYPYYQMYILSHTTGDNKILKGVVMILG